MKALLISIAVFLPFVPTGNHDGDTFKGLVTIRPGLYEEVTVRMQCPTDGGYYNAPELRADGGGVAETKRLGAWLGADAGYLLRTEWKQEKYGRLLGEPFRGDAGYCAEVAR